MTMRKFVRTHNGMELKTKAGVERLKTRAMAQYGADYAGSCCYIGEGVYSVVLHARQSEEK